MLTDIYAAGEAPIPGVTVDALAAAVRAHGRCRCTWCRRSTTLPARWPRLARPGDLVVTLGAGSIGGVADRILAALAAPDVPARGDGEP